MWRRGKEEKRREQNLQATIIGKGGQSMVKSFDRENRFTSTIVFSSTHPIPKSLELSPSRTRAPFFPLKVPFSTQRGISSNILPHSFRLTSKMSMMSRRAEWITKPGDVLILGVFYAIHRDREFKIFQGKKCKPTSSSNRRTKHHGISVFAEPFSTSAPTSSSPSISTTSGGTKTAGRSKGATLVLGKYSCGRGRQVGRREKEVDCRSDSTTRSESRSYEDKLSQVF